MSRFTPVAASISLIVFLSQWQGVAAQDQDIEAAPQPLFGSTADTVFDIIRTDDPNTFTCLEYSGRDERQIWDKRVDGEPVVNTYLFVSRYSDGTSVQIALNPEFGSVESARDEALRYVNGLGQLPTQLRDGIRRLSIHKGRQGFHAGDEQIIMYAEMTDDRLSYDHLEESIFHEAVHASWDAKYRLSPDWKNAQASDGRFLTDYAAASPEREDLAETALFAYAILNHPDRMPPVDTRQILQAIPYRMAFLEVLLPPGTAVHYQVRPAEDCAATDR